MPASSDFPVDPESGRVVDPEILAERRARRAEESELSPPERARPAERAITELEHRLADAGEALAAAQRERGLLAGALERAERDLTAALKREFAEQRRRTALEGDADSAVQALQSEIARLRTDHRRAEKRSTELVRALASERARAAAQGDVGAQVAELHRALRAVQVQVAAQNEHASAAITAAVTETRQLRGTLEALEEERRSAADGERKATTAARADELEAERERRRRAEALAETERGRFDAELTNIRTVLHAAVERGKRTADARLSELQRTLDGQRAQLEAAATQLEGRVAFERTARDVVERELAAERDARAAGTDTHAREVAELSARWAAAEVALAEAHEVAEVERGRRTALETGRDARRAGERDAVTVDPAATREISHEVPVADYELRGRLEEEQAARWVAETELARETAERAAAEQRAGAVIDELKSELERLRAAGGGNPVYDALTAGPLVPSADHPALSRAAEEPVDRLASPPTVVVDLARAAARLRAAEQLGATPAEELGGAGAPGPRDEAPGVIGDADATGRGVDDEGGSAPPAHPASFLPRGDVIGAAVLPSATAQPWFGPALARLAEVDAVSAERLLLAALSVQARRVGKEVAYAVVLPATGRHDVHVTPGGDVAIAAPGAPGRHDAEFSLEGSVEALAPLAAGAAPRRLPGVSVRGRRRRLRRLLRALRAPVGLRELHDSGARPRPGDLLALLCLGVPATSVRGADFGVAYTVCYPDGSRSRTLVRAEQDGSLTAIPEAPDLLPADATVTVDASGLLDVLAGAASASLEGDARAVAMLQGWLRAVQGLPA